MGIRIEEDKKIITLETENTMYQMQVDSFGTLLHLYYGKKCSGTMEHMLTYYDRGFSGQPYDAGNNRTYSLDSLPQEFPCHGNGDFRSTAVEILNANGAYGCDLRYQGHRVVKGKYRIVGLPAVYAEEAETLEVYLKDEISSVEAVLYFGVIPEIDIITRSVKLINNGNEKIYVKKAASACLDFLYGDYDLIHFYGRHAMERNYERTPVSNTRQIIGSTRGTSSHQHNPVILVADKNTTEEQGNCYALSFVYSGGFQAEAEKDQLGQTRVLMGLQQERFSYPLSHKEELWIPETVLTYSAEGFGKLSLNLHECYREHLCRGKYKNQVRPVLVNSWEAAYFDFTGETIYQLAKEAADTGIEMLVLDDGWFGKREDDNSSLGDWIVNEEKLGESLGSLIQRINALGVKFGIWVEPEMVSEDSELYRMHPDWALAVPGRNPVRSRNQLVLDFSRKEVVDYIYEKICGILDQGNIEYMKWDMNRSIADVYSNQADDQGRVLYDYVLGLYDFLERLVQRYPNLLIEGCSGGGGRFDAGMLYYTPQIWCSDNTDAIDRVRIQYGTSFGYPVCTVGSHVSAVPNHQTKRVTPFSTRAITAMAGTFGYELDLGKLSEEEKKEIRNQVETYHKYAPLIQNGNYYRLTNPYQQEWGAWEFASKDKKEALVHAVALETHGNMTVSYIRLRGLCADRRYRETHSGRIYWGGSLMEAGIPLPAQAAEYEAIELHFQMEEQE